GEVRNTSILKTARSPATNDLYPGDNAQDEPHLATIAKRFSALAHRDGRRSDGQPSLSEHCGHGPIFIVQRSAANDPGCVKTSSQVCVVSQFAGAIDEAIH